MSRYLFVINPVSGGLDKKELVAQIKSFCGKQSCEFDLFYTTSKNDLEKIEQEINRFQPQVLVVAGGDGSINMVTPLLLKYKLKLGIIPAGSANGLASEFGITKENMFEHLTGQRTVNLDIILLNNEKYLLHLADFGLNAMLVRRYEDENRRGLIGYAISALLELGKLEDPFRVTIETEKESLEFHTRFLVIANATQYGTGFEVNPAGKHGDHRVELCVLKEISPELIIELLTTEKTKENEPGFFDVHSVTKATIRCDRPIYFQSDGEYWGEIKELQVEVLDQPVQVLTQ